MGLSFIHHPKRMKRRIPQKMEIPNDVVMEEILARLPAKSLMRFKCVSKLWSSLISSRYFCNRFLTVPTRPRPRIYMCLQDNNDFRNNVTLSLAPDTTNPNCFVVDHNLTSPRVGGYVLQNLRGFMCYPFFRKPTFYNPATRQLVTIPAAFKSQNIIPAPPEEEAFKSYNYYFGYDSVIDQYYVLWSTGVYVKHLGETKSEHLVFVLKAGGEGSWKKAYPTSPDYLPHIPAKRGMCIDGVIYYMGWTGTYSLGLVSFHIRSGDFKMIQVPGRDGDEVFLRTMKNVSLIEYGGKVTIIDLTNLREKGMLDLWAVEDAGNKKSFTRKTMVLQSSQLPLVINNKTIYTMKGTTDNNKVFFIPEDMFSPFHILCYDLRSNDMTKIEIKGIPDHWFNIDRSTINVMLMDQSEDLVSLET
ncbi:F-box protein [Raphanus sativus]|uniref:F-box protein At2g40910-like n=1 Tax=Raphanus sativus TaxID=3726 RepID=A0A9W3CJN0_RAPSA|nr:F-box protein At2g40910-like [Raphanus sativus]KAJ4873885.1 F-box protein [Raphanus sativus]